MDRRIILIGKTGNGKSSTGNTLLGTSAFQTGNGLNAMTQTCQLRFSYNATNRLQYSILDTPGFMDTDVARLLEICPVPHAFLLIFSSINYMKKDEDCTVDLLHRAFGETVFDHCIVVFTNGSIFDSEQEFKKFWKHTAKINNLVNRCGGRIKRIENTGQVHYENEIIDLIETMSDSGNKMYPYSWKEQHQRVLQEHNDLGRQLRPDLWTFGATIMGGVAAAAAVVWSLASRARFW